MSTHEPARASVLDRLTDMVPKGYREEVMRVARGMRDRFPPIMIERRIDALERHIDRRFKEVETKLDELMRRVGSRAA